MMTIEKTFLFSGFGGQGILFMGKFLSYYGMLGGNEVSWIPSYGAEMRGGTASCGVCVSKAPIGSPVVAEPEVLVCMNLPSLDKFEKSLKKGGSLFVDSSLANRKSARNDVTAHYIPAAKAAGENKVEGLANMIMVGKLLDALGIYDADLTREAMKKTVPERKKELFESNLRAIEIGRSLKDE